MREWSAAALDAFPVGTRHARAGGQDGAANSASGARHARERVVQGPETNPTLPKGPKVHGTAIPARQGRRSNATWVSILSQRCPLGFASRLRRSLHRLEPNDTASRDQRPKQQRTGRGAADALYRLLPWGQSFLHLLDQLHCRFNRHLVVPALGAHHRRLGKHCHLPS